MSAAVFDDRLCELGEGPLWHPERGQLFWFDILGKRLLTRDETGPRHWDFPEHVSAAGWLSEEALLIASESALFQFDLATGDFKPVIALDADDPGTRSNDGRADPQGGFWIGTMGKAAEPGRGAIWRYFRGELRKLYPGITIPNAICFAPSGDVAYFADTAKGMVWRQRLNALGWPIGEPEVYLNHGPDGPNPDGAVVDADGRFWNAEWGSYRVAAYGSTGELIEETAVAGQNASCPAFGGADLSTLYVTTAREHLGNTATEADGLVYCAETPFKGQAEHQVIL